MKILKAQENLIESDEYFMNPGWFSSQATEMFEWTPSKDTFKPSTFNNATIVGGFILEIDSAQVVH